MTSVSVMKGDNCFTVRLQSQSLHIETAVFTSHHGCLPKRKTLITTERRGLAEVDTNKILYMWRNITQRDTFSDLYGDSEYVLSNMI